MTSDVLQLSAAELVENYRARRLSPVDVCRATFAAISAVNPVLNAFQHLDEESALAGARRSEDRWARKEPFGPVDGVPTTIKDNILTRGWPTLSGSPTTDPKGPWLEDAPGVARLRESGAV